MTNEGLLHVERTPIQKAAAAGRPLFDEVMNLGINDLHWELQRQFRERRRRIPIYPGSHSRPRTFHAYGDSPVEGLHFAENHEALSPDANEVLQAASAKRPATP
jgi:hypothetical protein